MSGYFLSKLKDNGGFKTIFTEKRKLEKMVNDNRTFCNLELKEKNLINFQENPNYKLDEDSFFFIDYMKSSEQAKNIINDFINVFNSVGDLSDLQSRDLSKVEFLLYGSRIKENILLNIQNVTSRFFIESRKYLLGAIEGKGIEYKNEKNALVLKNVIDLHINMEQHTILFKNFSNLRKIHKDFIELYREATEEEKIEFIKNVNDYALFKIHDNIKLEPTNLKKLKYWLDNKILDNIFNKKNKLRKYLKKYKKNIPFEIESGNQLSITNNKEFTYLSKVMDECFYQGEITGRMLESNSSKIIS